MELGVAYLWVWPAAGEEAGNLCCRERARQFGPDVALRGQDSLFTPGKPIWSSTNLQGLYSRFVEHPGTRDDPATAGGEAQGRPLVGGALRDGQPPGRCGGIRRLVPGLPNGSRGGDPRAG